MQILVKINVLKLYRINIQLKLHFAILKCLKTLDYIIFYIYLLLVDRCLTLIERTKDFMLYSQILYFTKRGDVLVQRSSSREKAFLLLFENSFSGYPLRKILEIKLSILGEDCVLDNFSVEIFNGVKENEKKIDEIIENHLSNWKKERISRVSLCALRIAIFEILYRKDIPESVSANEAVNLAKKYGGETEYAFVNGILGAVCSKEKKIVGAV